MKRFVKCRKILTNDEARQKIANLQQSLTVNQDNINYWKNKKELSFCDKFILGVDKLNSPEEFIQLSKENIEYLMKKIEDYKRFLDEPYKWFLF